MNEIDEFRQRLNGDWLLPFCAARGYSHEGFDGRNIENLSAKDVRDFLQSIDCELVKHCDGFFTAPQSKAKEQIFWQGDKESKPRKVTLWIEPIITIGALRRLHRDYHWPLNLLGLQSKTWAFDLVAYSPDDSSAEHLLCEVKKSPAEIDALIRHMQRHLDSELDVEHTLKAAERNAFRKVHALRRSKAKFFWALGPNQFEQIFEVHRDNGRLKLNSVDETFLMEPNNVTNNAQEFALFS